MSDELRLEKVRAHYDGLLDIERSAVRELRQVLRVIVDSVKKQDRGFPAMLKWSDIDNARALLAKLDAESKP